MKQVGSLHDMRSVLRGPARAGLAWLFALLAAGILVWAYVFLSQPTSDADWEALGRIMSFLMFFLPCFLASAIISLVLAQPRRSWLRYARLGLLGVFGLLAGSCTASYAPIMFAGVTGFLLFAVFGLPLLPIGVAGFIIAGRESRQSSHDSLTDRSPAGP